MKNLWLKVSFFLEELCGEHGSSGGSTESIMRESCEAPFLHSFLLESSDSHTHAMSSISIESSLWSTWIICVDEELFRGRGEIHAIERILIFSNGTFEFFSIGDPSNSTNTFAIWPSLAATRVHIAEIGYSSRFIGFPFGQRILSGSVSVFCSSPPI
jgi:hypothetical protein